MITTRILAFRIASLLLAPVVARAVTDTWSGGGADNNLSTDANWVDHTAPASSLADTVLIFTGGLRLTPNFASAFNTHSITMVNVPGPVGFGFTGEQVNVGAGGIVNTTSLSQFNNPVSFSGVANATIDGGSSGIVFVSGVTLPSGTLTVNGAAGFGNIFGTGTLNKAGSASLDWSPLVPVAFDFTISGGTVTMRANGGTNTSTVTETGTIGIAAGVFNSNGNLTLDGGLLTRGAAGAFNLADGRTLTVQNGGAAILTGAYVAPFATTLFVTGAGSTLSTTGSLTLSNGTSTSVLAGGSINTGTAGLQIGTLAGNGNLGVDGNGSTVNGGALTIGQNGFSGSVSFSFGSTGAFAAIAVQDSLFPGGGSALNIQSGATVTGTDLKVASMAAATTGSIIISGAESALTLIGAATATIGADSGSTATLTVLNGGTFTTGTGLTTVNATGDLNINAGGTMIVRGNMVVRSSLDIAGTVILGEGITPASGGFAEAVLNAPNDAGTPAGVVPEPGSAALLALGAGSVLGRRRKSAI